MDGFKTANSENSPTLKSPTNESYTIFNCLPIIFFSIFFPIGLINEIVMIVLFFKIHFPIYFHSFHILGLVFITISLCFGNMFPLKQIIIIDKENGTIIFFNKYLCICKNKKKQFDLENIEKIFTQINTSVSVNGSFGFNVIFELKNGEKEIVIKGAIDSNYRKENLCNFFIKSLPDIIVENNNARNDFQLQVKRKAPQNFSLVPAERMSLNGNENNDIPSKPLVSNEEEAPTAY